MTTILDTIMDSVYRQIETDKLGISPQQMREQALQVEKTAKNGFESALKHQGIAVIAEVKKASPSKGVICNDFDPVAIAHDYDQGGADAISVLTEPHFFQGHPDYLQQISQQVSRPLLRKDFIIDTYQIDQAVVLGASAVLLIAAILDDQQLCRLLDHCSLHNMDALVEVHDKNELLRVLDTPARMIGINNRNLRTFDVTLTTSLDLKPLIPATHVCVSESGIFTYQDVTILEKAGFDAILVGESLMRRQNRVQALKELRGE